MVRAAHLRALVVLVSLVVGLSLGEAPRTASAHGDDSAAPPPSGASLSPRLAARSGDFELVGVARGRTLNIYLDRFADNQPVVGAKLDVEADGQTIAATAQPDGTYTLTANWVAQPGHHAVIVAIMSGEGSDLLAGTLDIPPMPAAASGAVDGSAPPMPTRDNILAFLLGVLATVALQRRSALAGVAGGGAERVRRGGNHIVGVVRRGVADAKMRMRLAEPVAQAGSVSGRTLGASQPWLIGLTRRRRDLAAALNAMLERCNRSVAAARDSVLPKAAAVFDSSVVLPWRRVRGALAPIRMPSVAGRVGPSTVAGVLLAAIVVALALFLFGRGVLAHEADNAPPPAGPAPAAAGATPDSGPHRLLDGSLFVPKDSQRLLNVRTIVSKVSEVGRTVRMVGQVIADPGTSGEVHASIRGRLEPYRNAWPKVGQRVETGEVLAWVVPVVNPIDRGIILQQVAQIDHEIAQIQDRLPGLEAAESDASSRELDDARADLANLVRRRDAIAAVIKDRDTLRAPLLAPSTGIVAASFAAAGQIVDEQQKLFTVVDLKRLWVEAYAYDISAIGKVVDADAQGAAGGNYHLKFISRGPQLQRQTIPLYFQVDNPDETISVGSLVSVLVQTSGERSGVILPRTAVTRNASGQDIVWQHAYPESFVPIPVRTESIDGNNVLIAAGLPPDTRIVVEAAELLNEVR